jgi:putative transcriptional regulator
MQRDLILRELYDFLANQGFETSHIYERSCFDMVARRKLLLLFLKVLINIDGFSGKQAEEIKKVASTFLASPLIVGVKSKNELLEEDVVYERHGIPAITFDTLRNVVVDGIYPEIFADRGGYYVQIDGNKINEIRERENLSLKELADLAHVSRETIYKYEHGIVRACPETVIMLETIFNKKITAEIELFKIPEIIIKKMAKNIPKELLDLGFGVIKTNKTPFDAIAKDLDSQKSKVIITNMEKRRNYNILKKMAMNVKDLSGITESNAVFILETKKNLDNIEGISVIHNWELEEIESSNEFVKIVKERKECN